MIAAVVPGRRDGPSALFSWSSGGGRKPNSLPA
jgi:hypothetical protein